MSSQVTIPVITEGEFIESLNSMRIPEEKPQIPEDRSGWQKIDLENCQFIFIKCNTMNPYIEEMVVSSGVEGYIPPKKNSNTPKGELIYGGKDILKSNAVNIKINPRF